ncbi:MAG TPA: DUF488 domain-containing protein [Fredinandcohnia sp.]|nr:DUF488 domain-containing protein [Fredinandcohnia sp.]
MAGKLFTIGYEKRTLEEYLAILRDAGVTLLVDVRFNPLSHKKGFSKKALAQGAEAAGIRYAHMPELGIPSARRKGLETREQFDELFAAYARELPKKREPLERLRAWLDEGERVALTCFEREADRCHRRYVAEALGDEVQHL